MVNDSSVSKAPWSFWVIGTVALLYNAAGVANFIGQMSAESVAALPDLYRTIVEQRPTWITAAFALAVVGGAIGCIFLLSRKTLAYSVFIASLVGAAVTMIHTLGLTGPVAAPMGFVVGNLVQLVVTAFLIWYTKRAESSGWIS